MIRLGPAIVVEGCYDINKIRQIFDTMVIATEGFSIYKNPEKAEFIKRVAKERGVIILTDGDHAGFQIRTYLKNILAGCEVYHAYPPDVYGKEKRKSKASSEGKLGVEGIADAALIEAIRRSGAPMEAPAREQKGAAITKTDLYELGLSGGPDSARRRKALLEKMDLPENLKANALLEALNLFSDLEQLKVICGRLEE
ncbi:toprim domain-containing protein [Acidaminobacterium chupaoyuni]